MGDWQGTEGREQELVASEEFERRERWEGDSLRPSSLVNHYTFFFLVRATGDEVVGRVGYKLLLGETEHRMADRI